jgi:glutathione S-transferase
MSLLLYHHPISTCSQKVRLALAEKGLTFDQHVIDWGTQEHLSEAYLRLNPNGVVPTLVHDGQPIVDSSVICEYLDEVFPQPPLSPAGSVDRAKMRAWMRYFEEVPTAAIRVPSFNRLFAKSLKVLPATRFDAMTEKMPLRKHFYRQMGDQGFSPQATAESMERLSKCLQRVEAALADGRLFLLGTALSIADIVLVPSVVRMEDLGLAAAWDDLPGIARWYARIRARPSFARAFPPGSRVSGGSELGTADVRTLSSQARRRRERPGDSGRGDPHRPRPARRLLPQPRRIGSKTPVPMAKSQSAGAAVPMGRTCRSSRAATREPWRSQRLLRRSNQKKTSAVVAP